MATVAVSYVRLYEARSELDLVVQAKPVCLRAGPARLSFDGNLIVTSKRARGVVPECPTLSISHP